jgi:hypothetical protein
MLGFHIGGGRTRPISTVVTLEDQSCGPSAHLGTLNGPFMSWRALVYNDTTNSFVSRSQSVIIRRLGRDPGGPLRCPMPHGSPTQMPSRHTIATTTGRRFNRLEGWSAGSTTVTSIGFGAFGAERDSPRRPYCPIAPDGPPRTTF